jgi:hypothetical protein
MGSDTLTRQASYRKPFRHELALWLVLYNAENSGSLQRTYATVSRAIKQGDMYECKTPLK